MLPRYGMTLRRPRIRPSKNPYCKPITLKAIAYSNAADGPDEQGRDGTPAHPDQLIGHEIKQAIVNQPPGQAPRR